MTFSLYSQDYQQWLQTTIAAVRSQQYQTIDWDNLIEELESMGKSEKRALLSLLTWLLEHLLKLAYWETEKHRSGNHWASEIVNFRAQIQATLSDSPSLRPQLPNFYEQAYPTALKSVSKLFALPQSAVISLDQALDENWFPAIVS